MSATLTLRSLRAGWPRTPQTCAVCGTWNRHSLCRACRQRFAPTRLRCPVCALPAVHAGPCASCQQHPPAVVATAAAVDYGFPWDRLIGDFKFRQQPEWAAALAGLVEAAITGHGQLPAAELVLPVPLSPARLAERGYNQAWELARRLARGRRLPAHADWLLRLRDTPHQVGAGRAERLRNLRAAMWVTPTGTDGLRGRQVALVDDVLTTGATAQAAAQALHDAGAAGVQLWVVARTPAPDLPD